jgi:GTP-binding protein
VFVVNKWDLAKAKIASGDWADYLRKVIPALDYVPIAFITAKEGKNVYRVLNLAQALYKQAAARVGTSELNQVIQGAVDRRPPPSHQNRTPRIYYATQAAVCPPTIVLFTNGPELFTQPWLRYLLKTFREQLPFAEVPLRIELRRRGSKIPNAIAPKKSEVELIVSSVKKENQRAERATAERKLNLWRDL